MPPTDTDRALDRENINRSRLYYGRLLRSIRYSPAWDDKPANFYVHIRYDKNNRLCVAYLEAPTIPELIAKVKAGGWVIWGKDKLDYAGPPENALEYLLMEQVLKAEGATDDEIRELFSLNTAAAPAADDEEGKG